MIITRFSQLLQAYYHLEPGDIFLGQIPSSFFKPAMLVDLGARGVKLIPSATAQLVNASKATQAFLLLPWMLEHTTIITRRKDLLDALSVYQQNDIKVAVSKADRLHCGHGVFKWDNLDTLYSCVSMEKEVYPFVLQPYVETFTDVRVVIVDTFCEAYSRINPNGFRMNLAAGGKSRPHELTPEQDRLCRQVMQRAQMPYAHIDLMIMPDGKIFLSEIRLNGGVQGARVDRPALEQMKKIHLMALAEATDG
jgi:glutathione synthase/RimK-type ligase-like ATP-grasp enzyme